MKRLQKSKSNNENEVNYSKDVRDIPWIGPNFITKKKSRYYYDTGDLVIIALFSALGGIFSTFIGYIGNLMNSILGVPFGAGQIIAGLHIFWITFIYLLTERKIGTALFAGILKGFIEFFSGSAHGILVIAMSGTQGLVIELFIVVFLSTNNRFILSMASGFSSMSNVVLQQILFFNSQVPFYFVVFISIISFISGTVFGGLFAISMFNLYSKSTILNWKKPLEKGIYPKNIRIFRFILVFLLIISEISIFSYFAFKKQHSVEITGNVYNPYTFYMSDFPKIRVEAELIGDVTYIPPRNYTGVSLTLVVEIAQPKTLNYIIRVIASDGYFKDFSSLDLNNDDTIILSESDSGIGVIAGSFHGSFWVEKVIKIQII